MELGLPCQQWISSSIKIPLIVRLEGTNVEEGRHILKESMLTIISADGMADAAEKAVESLKKGN